MLLFQNQYFQSIFHFFLSEFFFSLASTTPHELIATGDFSIHFDYHKIMLQYSFLSYNNMIEVRGVTVMKRF